MHLSSLYSLCGLVLSNALLFGHHFLCQMQFVMTDLAFTVVKATIHDSITLKPPVRPGTFASVLLDWNSSDHQFYFNLLDDLLLDNDQAIVQWLCPVSQELPWKRIGDRKGDQRLQVCAKGLSCRTKIFFAYSCFDLLDGVLVNQWAPVEGMPGAKKPQKPK